MANVITDEMMDYVGILAKLELSEEEREQAKKDMGRMLDYIDLFREDVVRNEDEREQMLANAPAVKDGAYKVPKTVE